MGRQRLASFLATAVTIAALTAAPASAGECPYTGSVEALAGKYEAAILKAQKLGSVEKGDFETTAAFDERAHAIARGFGPDGVLTAIWPVRDGSFEYDADNQRGRFRDAIHLICTDTFADAAPDWERRCTNLEFRRTSEGRRSMSNAFGAAVRSNVVRVEKIGFYFLGHHDASDDIDLDFAADVDEAKSLREHAALVLQLEMMPPFYKAGSFHYGGRFDSPDVEYGDSYYLAAALRCVSLIDTKTGKVHGSRQFPPL